MTASSPNVSVMSPAATTSEAAASATGAPGPATTATAAASAEAASAMTTPSPNASVTAPVVAPADTASPGGVANMPAVIPPTPPAAAPVSETPPAPPTGAASVPTPEALVPQVPAPEGTPAAVGPGAAVPPTIGSLAWTPETAPASAAGPTSMVLPPTVPTPAAAETERAASAAPTALDSGTPIPTAEGIFAQSSAALAALQSYRYTTVFSFTGEGQSGPESGSVEVHGAVAGSDRQEMTWKALDTGDQFGVLRVGDQAWMLDGETWNSVPTAVADVMSQLVLAFAPSMTWSGLAEGMEMTSTYVGAETVNGVPARHYTSTYRGWSQYWEGGISDASGDIWIAEAGYPLRYRFTAKGLDKDGNSGSMLWTMEITDVNGAVSIEVPLMSGDSGADSPTTAVPTAEAAAGTVPAMLPPIAPTSSTSSSAAAAIAATSTGPGPSSSPELGVAASPTEAVAPQAAVAATPVPAVPVAPVLPELTQEQIDQATQALDELFSSSSNALAGLQSYRYTTVFSFTGESDVKPESGSMEIRGAVVAPDRLQATWKDLATGSEFGVVRVGNQAWMLEGEDWSSVPTMVADAVSQAILVFAPSVSWGALSQGMGTESTYVGTETVNGISARHYTSTYPAWSQYWDGQVEDASGDVWLAEAGYPVRYRFAAKGIDQEGYKGSVLWTMELSDVNGPVSIEAPQETAGAGPGSP